MTRARLDGLLLFLLGSVLFVLMGTAWDHSSPVSMVDFKGIYFGARCLLQHTDRTRKANSSASIWEKEGKGPPIPLEFVG